jgi:hypothetical protein
MGVNNDTKETKRNDDYKDEQGKTKEGPRQAEKIVRTQQKGNITTGFLS